MLNAVEDQLRDAKREVLRWKRVAEERALEIRRLRERAIRYASGELCSRCGEQVSPPVEREPRPPAQVVGEGVGEVSQT